MASAGAASISAPSSTSSSASSNSSFSCGNQLHRFRYVLQNINLEAIPNLATSIRASKTPSPEPGIVCTLDPEPLYGSFNIHFRLDFSDGISWLLKVPARGHSGTFDESDAEALRSEALTMRLIKSETSVPIPEVYAFDTSLDNDVKCPYTLMEYIDASPLSIYWFDVTITEEALEQRRTKTLLDLAAVVLQLNKFRYDQAGRLLYDDEEAVKGIGSVRNYDLGAIVQRAEQQVAEADDDDEDFENCDDSPLFCEAGPFSDPKKFLLWMLDRRDSCKLEYTKGTYHLLRVLVQWFLAGVEPQLDDTRSGRFVLSHPDLDLQNILVSSDGQIRALIDWDGVGTVPDFMGNNSYPTFLLRDRDPSWFYAAQDNEVAMSQCSPRELSRYRKIYEEAIAGCLAERHDETLPEDDWPSKDALKKTTRRSLIIETLQYATHNVMFTHRVMDLLFNEIIEVVRPTPGIPPPPTQTNGSGDFQHDTSRASEASTETNINGLLEATDDIDSSSDSDTFEDKDDNGFGAQEPDSASDLDSDLDSLTDSESLASVDISSNTDHSNHLVNAEQQWFEDNFTIYEVGDALAAGTLDERRMKLLRDGFEALCA
ncbi:MAG: hypothetical protein MMC33_007642 [Icmadophila ericetorum]|nr:hypothetical protein [Icmadophila ericetorum]